MESENVISSTTVEQSVESVITKIEPVECVPLQPVGETTTTTTINPDLESFLAGDDSNDKVLDLKLPDAPRASMAEGGDEDPPKEQQATSSQSSAKEEKITTTTTEATTSEDVSDLSTDENEDDDEEGDKSASLSESNSNTDHSNAQSVSNDESSSAKTLTRPRRGGGGGGGGRFDRQGARGGRIGGGGRMGGGGGGRMGGGGGRMGGAPRFGPRDPQSSHNIPGAASSNAAGEQQRSSGGRGHAPLFRKTRYDGSEFVSNWGHRTNLYDEHGYIIRSTPSLSHFVASYKEKYIFYMDLVNTRYPQLVRTFENNAEVWRMAFNIYATGFSEYIVHLGEIHAFYHMDLVNDELKWAYKDFNFYPNPLRYGFRVNSFDIADVYSRLIKLICIRDTIIQSFPYVGIRYKPGLRKFEHNLNEMMSRLNEVKLLSEAAMSSGEAAETVAATTTATAEVGSSSETGDERVQQSTSATTENAEPEAVGPSTSAAATLPAQSSNTQEAQSKAAATVKPPYRRNVRRNHSSMSFHRGSGGRPRFVARH